MLVFMHIHVVSNLSRRFSIMFASLCLLCVSICPNARGAVLLVIDDVAPFAYHEGAQIKGVAYELLTEMSTRIGNGGAVALVPLPRQLDMIKRTPNVIGMLGRVKAREKSYSWIVKLLDEHVVLLVAADSKVDASSIDKVRKLRVGVIRGGPAELLANELGFAHIDGAPTAANNARKLAIGRIDVWLATWGVAAHGQKQAGLDPKRLRRVAQLQQFGLYLAGPVNFDPAEAAKWKRALAGMKLDGSYARILQKYNYALPAPDQLSAPERMETKAHPARPPSRG